MAKDILKNLDDPYTQDEFNIAVELAKHTSTSQSLSLIMILLDKYLGLHLLVLERPNEDSLDGPIRIQTPDNMWFVIFQLIAELAYAIIVIGDVGYHLLHEMQYLGESGLRNRVLVSINEKILSFKGREYEELEKWSIVDVDKAVKFAAEQKIGI